MNSILTAAAAGAAAAAASGPAGWIALAVVGVISLASGLLLMKSRNEKEEDRVKTEEEIQAWKEITDNIKESQGIKEETQGVKEEVAEKKEELPLGRLTDEQIAEYKAMEEAGLLRDSKVVNDYDKEFATERSLTRGGIVDWYTQNPVSKNHEVSTPQDGSVTTVFEQDATKDLFYNPPMTGTKEEIAEKEETGDNNTQDVIPPIPTIKDETEANLENKITIDASKSWEKWHEIQNAAHSREDEIRKHIEEREDTAYQRAVADMKKAGINPNLMNVNPAESGGGINTATIPDMSTITTDMNLDIKEMQQLIDQAFKGDENSKDRFNSLFTSLLTGLALILTRK